MTTPINDIRQQFRIGDRQYYGGMSVFPVFPVKTEGPEYISLKQALNQHLLIITEVHESGSVPQLKAVNQGFIPILLLDGEEVSGAKQNRILNTTILLREKSETVIPVSCTEQGRWSYDKPFFEESGNIMAANIRSEKLEDVSYSLKSSGSFRSDQSKVWDGINVMANRLEVHSDTGAMKDVYAGIQNRLEDYLQRFPILEGQAGIAVCIGGRMMGLDYVSSPAVWSDLHTKLVQSYAVDCLNRELPEQECDKAELDSFWDRFAACRAQVYPSVGYGEDYRFESPQLIGAGLYWQETFIHLELYARSAGTYETVYHSPRNRRLHY
jgi:hypothetical protein